MKTGIERMNRVKDDMTESEIILDVAKAENPWLTIFAATDRSGRMEFVTRSDILKIRREYGVDVDNPAWGPTDVYCVWNARSAEKGFLHVAPHANEPLEEVEKIQELHWAFRDKVKAENLPFELGTQYQNAIYAGSEFGELCDAYARILRPFDTRNQDRDPSFNHELADLTLMLIATMGKDFEILPHQFTKQEPTQAGQVVSAASDAITTILKGERLDFIRAAKVEKFFAAAVMYEGVDLLEECRRTLDRWEQRARNRRDAERGSKLNDKVQTLQAQQRKMMEEALRVGGIDWTRG